MAVLTASFILKIMPRWVYTIYMLSLIRTSNTPELSRLKNIKSLNIRLMSLWTGTNIPTVIISKEPLKLIIISAARCRMPK